MLNKLKKPTAKGYGWYNNDTGSIKYGTNGMQDVTAKGLIYQTSNKG